VEFASPGGRRPPVDPESLRRRYWKAHPERLAEARALVDTLTALRAPRPLEIARRESARYAGVIVPGGQAVMSTCSATRPRTRSCATSGVRGARWA
jgi:hypothetical protein